MENSKAYSYIVKILNSIGQDRDFLYDYNIIEELYDFEREYIEERIWNSYGGKNGNYLLAGFLPLLKNYDGIKKLETNLELYDIPSSASVETAKVLLNYTSDKKYADIIIKNIESQKNNKFSLIASLFRIMRNSASFNMFKQIYFLVKDDIDVMVAAEGLLYVAGIINSPDDILHDEEKIKLLKQYCVKSYEEKSELVKKLNWNTVK